MTDNRMTESIKLEKLDIGYLSSKSTKKVACNLFANLNRGEMTCLLGPNGTGKSTLIKTICGFLKPVSGTVSINGQNTTQLDEKEMAKHVAIVLTDKIMLPNATVYELVMYGRSPYTNFLGRLSAEDKEIINRSIEMCGIAHKKSALLSTLSDGERQKATIAKALAQDTPIIILDEPTAFLDLPARVEIMHLLRSLASDTGKSVLMSTHDLDLALQMSDELWLLQKDCLISGTPEDLVLQNAFQPMFNNGSIEFDNKTGLFKVAYDYNVTVPVKGHGFKYTLLRRALMRKGIKPVKAIETDCVYIEIAENINDGFVVWNRDQVMLKTNSVGEVIKQIIDVTPLLLSADNRATLVMN